MSTDIIEVMIAVIANVIIMLTTVFPASERDIAEQDDRVYDSVDRDDPRHHFRILMRYFPSPTSSR